MQRPDDGVAPGWWGTDGAWHDVDPASAAALRAAQHGDADRADGPVPTWFVGAGDEAALHSPCVVHLEDGTSARSVERLPADLPLGAHVLVPDDGGPTTNLFVVAPRSPRATRQWGWSTQLYATRSRSSWGSGDLADLAELARWADASGAGLLAHNPLGATLPIAVQQPSPYSPSSRRFWSPAYLRIEDVASSVGVPVTVGPLAEAAAAGRALNGTRRIERDEVWRLKVGALEELWVRARDSDRCRRLLAGAADDSLLRSFAEFCLLAERFGSGWSAWPARFRHPDAEAVRRAAAEQRDRVEFWAWVQLETDAQLAAAAGAGAPLMADLPVGFDRDGFDAWVDQDLLALEWSVGAPPDEFNSLGQDWGLPPYVPSRLRDAGYRPWIDTVRRILRHAGALRVDHVMGLFRLFWIPLDGDARSGGYVQQFGTELLDLAVTEAVRAGAALIGEDLGTVEDHVRGSLAHRGVFGYRIAWFEDDPPDVWPANTLGSLTTHDLPTLAGLWTGTDEADRIDAGLAPDAEGAEVMRRRIAAAAGMELPTDRDAADAGADELRLAAHAALARSGSDVVVATLEDAIGVTERTNLPGTVDEHPNWRLALPVPLDELDAAGAAEVGDVLRAAPDRCATAPVGSAPMTDAPDVPTAPDSPFGLRGVVNLRDVGGQRTLDGGRVRTGVLYRSGQLDQQDGDTLGHLGLQVVFDLRGHDELDVAPDRVPEGVEVVHLDVLADSRERIATHLSDLLTQPELAEETMRSGLVEEHYRTTYRELVVLDSARAAYAELFTRVAELDGPALFHCTAGKDRTGWAAAVLLTLLGVGHETVTEDYLRSSQPVLASFASVLDRFAEAGGDPSLLVPVFAVTAGYLQAARDALDEEFGSIEAYFTDGLELDVEVHERLRSRLVDATG